MKLVESIIKKKKTPFILDDFLLKRGQKWGKYFFLALIVKGTLDNWFVLVLLILTCNIKLNWFLFLMFP